MNNQEPRAEHRAVAFSNADKVGAIPATPFGAGVFANINTDDFHQAHGSAVSCCKGGIAGLAKAAAVLRQIQPVLDTQFYEFTKTRLGLTPEITDFFLRVAELNIDPGKYSPAIDVKLARLLEALHAAVGGYNAPTAPTASNVVAPVANNASSPSAALTPADETVTTPPAMTPENIPTKQQAGFDPPCGSVSATQNGGAPVLAGAIQWNFQRQQRTSACPHAQPAAACHRCRRTGA